MATKKLIHDYNNIGLIKDFRDSYGFTQEELASLLSINRAQLSMAESLARSLPQEAVGKCLDLKNIFINAKIDTVRDWNQYTNDRLENFHWQCQQAIISLQHQIELIKKELPEMEKLEQQQRTVINNWDNISGEAAAILPTNYKSIITARSFAKLAKCDAAARMDKQLQIKIFLARIDVLKELIALQPSGVASSPE